MKRSKCLKLTVECREAGYRAVTGVKASSVVKEWQAKALNKALNHLTVAERNRKWPWLWRKLSWDEYSEIRQFYKICLTTRECWVKRQIMRKLYNDPKESHRY